MKYDLEAVFAGGFLRVTCTSKKFMSLEAWAEEKLNALYGTGNPKKTGLGEMKAGTYVSENGFVTSRGPGPGGRGKPKKSG